MPEKKLRILAASDIHGDSRQFAKLAQRAEKEKVDLVVLCEAPRLVRNKGIN
jgi:Icc-related predicted phosphoesterase